MTIKKIIRQGSVGVMVLLSTTSMAENYTETAKGKAFIQEMTGQFDYSSAALTELLSQVSRDEKILEKISRPAEKTMPWYKYEKIFLDQPRIDNGIHFYRDHEQTLNEAYDKYGVPQSIIVAILGVETRYGKVMGDDRVIDALATIGFDYPKREAFFTKELKAFLQMTKQEGLDPLALKGSYAGAMGMAQFMPSSYLNYAVDYEGDGKRDLWKNPNDAIFSVANYLAEHGWKRDEVIVDEALSFIDYKGKLQHKPFTTAFALKAHGVTPIKLEPADESEVGLIELEGEQGAKLFMTFHNFAVITTYNTSPMYALAVAKLASELEARL